MERSILARLAPEIRNDIYAKVFTSRYAVKLRQDSIEHPLTATCRQIRNESLEMFLRMTRFNAHLDDGPAAPLAHWLKVMGPERCLLLPELNVWDMHMLNGTLHGTEATEQMLRTGTVERESYVLRPVGRQVFHRGWWLNDVMLALRTIGLGLALFCIVGPDQEVKETSHFAVKHVVELEGVQEDIANIEALIAQSRAGGANVPRPVKIYAF